MDRLKIQTLWLGQKLKDDFSVFIYSLVACSLHQACGASSINQILDSLYIEYGHLLFCLLPTEIHSAFYCGYDCTKLCPLGLHTINMSFLSTQVVNILYRAMCGLPLAKSHNNRKFTHVNSLLFYLAADPQNLPGFVYAPEHLSRFFMLLFSCLGIFYRVLNLFLQETQPIQSVYIYIYICMLHSSNRVAVIS